jgi:hypothetical protein
MNVEIGAEAPLFPEKEYISGIFVTVCTTALYINDNAGFRLDRPSVTRPASTVGSTSPRDQQKAMDSGQVSLQISAFFNCFIESILPN